MRCEQPANVCIVDELQISALYPTGNARITQKKINAFSDLLCEIHADTIPLIF